MWIDESGRLSCKDSTGEILVVRGDCRGPVGPQGPTGARGARGSAGKDGISPTLRLEDYRRANLTSQDLDRIYVQEIITDAGTIRVLTLGD
jgi:hypothetical protein